MDHIAHIAHITDGERRDPYLIPAPGVDLPIMNRLTTLALCTVVFGCGSHDGLTDNSPGNALPPVLVTGPAPRVVPISTTWTFTVAAIGSRLTYQWRRNGQAVAGATAASFSFAPKFTQDGGSVDVVVSNSGGSVTSGPVDVKVVNTQGPWQQDLKIAVGSDPEHFGAPTTFVAQAGVVSVAKRTNGQLIAVFQWFPFADPASFDLVAASVSNDAGRTWSAPKTLTFTGLPAGYQRPFDPTLTVREDGSLRLYFTCSPTTGPNPPVNGGFCSAISTDGLNYSVEPGQRFYPGRSTVDCAVIRWNGQWHLTSPIGAPQEGAYHAVSSDGLAFTRVADIPSTNGVNWTGNLVVVGSALRFYGSPLWYASTTDGVSWTSPAFLGIQGGDPAVVEAEVGRWLIVYSGAPGT